MPPRLLALHSTHTPRAKRVIFLFMNGGPSHVDTFDPKPSLSRFEGAHSLRGIFTRSPRPPGSCHPPLPFNDTDEVGSMLASRFLTSPRSSMNAVSFVPCTPMCQIMSLPCSRCTRATFSPFDPPLDPGCFMAWEVKTRTYRGMCPAPQPQHRGGACFMVQ